AAGGDGRQLGEPVVWGGGRSHLAAERHQLAQALRDRLARGREQAGERGRDDRPHLCARPGAGEVAQRRHDPVELELAERSQRADLGAEGGGVELTLAREEQRRLDRGGPVGQAARAQPVGEGKGEPGAVVARTTATFSRTWRTG